MVMIGELAYRARFDGRELTRGLMSTRQQMSAAKKLLEESRTPADRYAVGLQNLADMSKRYSHVAEKQAELSKQLERSYLQEESAIRRLTKAERSRLELLQLSEKIKERAAAAPGLSRAARNEANKRDGLARQSFFLSIDEQQAAGRASLQERLKNFKRSKADKAAAYDINNDPIFSRMGSDGIGSRFMESSTRSPLPPKLGLGGLGAVGLGMKAMGGAMAVVKLAENVAAMKQFASESQVAYAELEKVKTSLRVFSGSAAATESMIKAMRQLTVESGVSVTAQAKAASTLMGYGVSAEETTKKLRELATIANGNEERFNGLALAFGQVRANGRLMAEELNQMTERQFNPLEALSKATGKGMPELRQMMLDGKVGWEMISQAATVATSRGGTYFGMLEAGADTTQRAMAKNSAAWEQAKTDTGEALAPLTKWYYWMQTEFAKSISAMAAPWQLSTQAIKETSNALDTAKSKMQDAMTVQVKGRIVLLLC